MYKHLILGLLVTIFFLGCKEEDVSQNETNSSQTSDIVITDNNACLENDIHWGKVTDAWNTTSGQFSEDGAIWIRSQIPIEPTTVTAYYYKADIYSGNDYLNLGRYSVIVTDEVVHEFDVMVHSAYLGSSSYIYFQLGDDCYRTELPFSTDDNISAELTKVQAF